jgi:hypothetical protein
VAEAHEAVMEVAGVGLVPALSVDRAPQDREHRVVERHAQDEHRDEERAEEEERVARERVIGSSADRDRRDRELDP